MMFRKELGKHNLTSLVKRQRLYTILTRNRDRNSTGIMTGMIEKLKVLPETARVSIMFDRGMKFAYSPLLKQRPAKDRRLTRNEIMRSADKALYQAKSEGRGGYRSFGLVPLPSQQVA